MQYFKYTLLLVHLLIFIPSISYAGQEVSGLPEFTKVIEKAGPSVVNISTVNFEAQNRKLVPDHLRDDIEGTPLMDLLRDVLGGDLENVLSGGGLGLGSGIIVSSDGYIVTNNHVVQDADEIYVRLSDRREFLAEVVGVDPGTDIALLKIEATDLPAIQFSDKSKLAVGQWVLAIGSPYGFEHTVTVGVVSAKARSVGSEQYVPFIQSDVAINPGNSGGPLLNTSGEMIGVNSQIVSQSGEFAGLSFAVPSYIVASVVEQIKTRGRVQRPWVGLAFQDVSRDLAQSFGLPKTEGALVTKVMPDSPAAKSGMKQGDVILAFNREEVVHASDLPPMIGILPIEAKVTLQVVRDKKQVSVELMLEKAPQKRIVVASDKPVVAVSNKVQYGIKVRLMDEEEVRHTNNSGDGVYVEKVEGAHWLLSNVRRGDIIVMFNQKKVSSVSAFYELLDKAPHGQPVSMLIIHPGEVERYSTVRLPKG